eukprot:10261195-Lingulodinium_polyedra.AAC.1
MLFRRSTRNSRHVTLVSFLLLGACAADVGSTGNVVAAEVVVNGSWPSAAADALLGSVGAPFVLVART